MRFCSVSQARMRGAEFCGSSFARTSAPPKRLAKLQGFLLPRYGVRVPLVLALQSALAHAAKRAGCSTHVTPHRLRHSFATEMLRLGVSLPALMKLLGHKDIR